MRSVFDSLTMGSSRWIVFYISWGFSPVKMVFYWIRCSLSAQNCVTYCSLRMSCPGCLSQIFLYTKNNLFFTLLIKVFHSYGISAFQQLFENTDLCVSSEKKKKGSHNRCQIHDVIGYFSETISCSDWSTEVEQLPEKS